MGDAGRDAGADSVIPAGYTYFGQFVHHDITLDVSSTIDAVQDATTINNESDSTFTAIIGDPRNDENLIVS